MNRALVCFLVFAIYQPAQGFSLHAIQKNNLGAKLLKEDRPYEASQNLIDGLADAPLQAETHLNLGLAFEKQGEMDKAFHEYLFAARNARTPALQFQAFFNAAHIQGQQQNIPAALSLYQQALDIDPQSLEAKTNIELLLKQQSGGKGQSQQNKKQGGKGNGQNQQQPQDQKKQQQQQQQQQAQEPRQQPQQFKSQELTQEDVRRILEELKHQEEKVRANNEDHAAKESPGGKNW